MPYTHFTVASIHQKIRIFRSKDNKSQKHTYGWAWCQKGKAAVTKNGHLYQLANQHLEAALPQVASGNYEGKHWLASFAVYALTTA